MSIGITGWREEGWSTGGAKQILNKDKHRKGNVKQESKSIKALEKEEDTTEAVGLEYDDSTLTNDGVKVEARKLRSRRKNAEEKRNGDIGSEDSPFDLEGTIKTDTEEEGIEDHSRDMQPTKDETV